MDEAKKRGPRWTFWIIVGLVVLLVLYPLSYGPVVWLTRSQWVPNGIMPMLSTIYEPLDWLTNQSDLLAGPFLWYLSLWLPRP